MTDIEITWEMKVAGADALGSFILRETARLHELNASEAAGLLSADGSSLERFIAGAVRIFNAMLEARS